MIFHISRILIIAEVTYVVCGYMKLYHAQRTWYQANASCHDEGGTLAKLETMEKLDEAVRQFINHESEYVWIGYSSQNKDGVYRWPDGSNTLEDASMWEAAYSISGGCPVFIKGRKLATFSGLECNTIVGGVDRYLCEFNNTAECGSPPVIKNANLILADEVVGMRATYTCHEGFSFSDGRLSHDYVCGEMGMWNVNDQCYKACADPSYNRVVNGALSLCLKYLASGTKAGWEEALATCQADGATLVHMKNESYRDAIFLYLRSSRDISTSYWMGLNDSAMESDFRWTDGSRLEWASWHPNNPSGGSQRNCISFKYPEMWWHDIVCSFSVHYLCQLPDDNWKDEPETIQEDQGSYCFIHHKNESGMRIPDASQYCQEKGARLVEVTTQNQAENLHSLAVLKNLTYWLGISDGEGIISRFMTFSGKDLHFTNWNTGFPQPDKHCVRADPKQEHKWTSVNCETDLAESTVCSLAACDDPPDMPYATMENGTDEMGIKHVRYTCDSGFAFSDNKTTKEYSCCGAQWGVSDSCQLHHCPSNYVHVKNETLGLEGCFRFYSPGLNWTDALLTCEKDGSTLLNVKTENYLEFLDQIGAALNDSNPVSHLWIGLSDTKLESVFRWTDGSPLWWQNWIPTSPSGAKDENCVQMMTNDSLQYRWSDEDCSLQQSFVCEYPKNDKYDESQEVNYTDPWCAKAYPTSNALQYIFVEVLCKSEGGLPLAPQSKEDLDALLEYPRINSMGSYWIGFSQQLIFSKFVSASGELMRFENWYDGFPAPLGICVAAYPSAQHRWKTITCSDMNPSHYFCQFPKCLEPVSSPRAALTTTETVEYTMATYTCIQGWTFADGSTSKNITCCGGDRKWDIVESEICNTTVSFDPNAACQGSYEAVSEGGATYCFYLSINALPWQSAQTFCSKFVTPPGTLVALYNQTKANALGSFLQSKRLSPSHSIWTGLTDSVLESDFRWPDQNRLEWEAWLPGQPSGGVYRNCVITYNDSVSYHWADRDCAEHHSFVCEYFAENVTETTAAANATGSNETEKTCLWAPSGGNLTRMGFGDAAALCEGGGGYLAEAQDELQLANITEAAQHLWFPVFWISLTDKAIESRFITTRGRDMLFNNFKPGFPRQAKYGNCILATISEWIDVSCNIAANVLCALPACPDPPDVLRAEKTVWTSVFGTHVNYTCDHGYSFTNGQTSWLYHCCGQPWVLAEYNCTVTVTVGATDTTHNLIDGTTTIPTTTSVTSTSPAALDASASSVETTQQSTGGSGETATTSLTTLSSWGDATATTITGSSLREATTSSTTGSSWGDATTSSTTGSYWGETITSSTTGSSWGEATTSSTAESSWGEATTSSTTGSSLEEATMSSTTGSSWGEATTSSTTGTSWGEATTSSTTGSSWGEATSLTGANDHTKCKTSQEGKEYQGTESRTINGRICQRWDSQVPHSHANTDPNLFKDGSVSAAANYCRNPDGTLDGPWCYTLDLTRRREGCSIGWCPIVAPTPQCSYVALSPATSRDNEEVYVGAVVTYTCDVGFHFHDGSSTRVVECLPTAVWSSPIPECKAVTCQLQTSSPPTVPVVSYGETFTTSCTNVSGKQFLPDGRSWSSHLCTSQRRLVPSLHPCQPRCPPVPHVTHAGALDGTTDLGTNVTFGCDLGHRFPDGYRQKIIYCQTDSAWNVISHPPCIVITCPPVPNILNSQANTTLAIYGTVVEITCLPGYRFYGNVTSQIITCQDNGQWSQALSPCTAIICPAAPSIADAARSGTDHHLGDIVTYQCQGGRRFYDGSQTKAIQCSVHQTWNDTALDCTSNRCAPSPTTLFSFKNSTLAEIGTTVEYRCLPGYAFADLEVFHVTTCNPSLRWDPSIPTCNIIHCPDVTPGEHVVLSTSSTEYGSRVNVTCMPGYELERDATVEEMECEANGHWSKNISTFSCSPVVCPPLKDFHNSTPDSWAHTFPVSITYSCTLGHVYQDGGRSRTLQCLPDGSWSLAIEDCNLVHCPPLPTWEKVQVNSTSTSYGSIVNYTCTEGFTLPDGYVSRLAWCGQQGLWRPEILDCTNKTEYIPPAPEEAARAEDIGSVAIGALVFSFSLVLIADLSTAPRDFAILKRKVWPCFNNKGQLKIKHQEPETASDKEDTLENT